MENEKSLVKQDTQIAALSEKNISDTVLNKIHKFQNEGQIFFPDNYSPENALKSAYLILSETVDKDKQPVLQSCSRESIANCLLNMVIQGLNPAKKQCYFIPYGKKLTLMPSYFGYQAIAKQFGEIIDIVAEVVYSKDDFEFEIYNTNKKITKHKRTLESMEDRKIRAAYCTIIFKDGREKTEIMTIDQIQISWQKSKSNPNDEKSVHKLFPEDMAKRTVINKTLKYYINTKDDTNLVLLKKAFEENDEELSEVESEYEVSQNANTQEIDFETGEIIEAKAINENTEVPPALNNINDIAEEEKKVQRSF